MADTGGSLASLRAEWDKPFLAGPHDEAANAARAKLTRDLAAAILAADLLDRDRQERTRVGALYLVSAGWSKETGDRADAAGEPGSPEWWAALGPHENAVLTADGRGADYGRWCRCGAGGLEPEGVPAGEWVRYERWSDAGCEAHGFVHSECRRLLQAG